MKCKRPHLGEPPDAIARVIVKGRRSGVVLLDDLVCRAHLDMQERAARTSGSAITVEYL